MDVRVFNGTSGKLNAADLYVAVLQQYSFDILGTYYVATDIRLNTL